jgi:hypothetical protein
MVVIAKSLEFFNSPYSLGQFLYEYNTVRLAGVQTSRSSGIGASCAKFAMSVVVPIIFRCFKEKQNNKHHNNQIRTTEIEIEKWKINDAPSVYISLHGVELQKKS